LAETIALLAAVFSSVCGMGWLALAKTAHWQQVHGQPPASDSARTLHALGAVALGSSLLLCLWVDHPSMGSLVWLMSLTASALIVAFTLAWKPRWLSWLVVWMR
jgi:hypothetical protein